MSISKELSCWNKDKKLTPSNNSTSEISFNDVMSEQLAHQILEKEENLSKVAYNCHPIKSQDGSSNDLFQSDKTETDSDFLLAQLLQQEYDKEYDNHLERRAKHFNGESKVSLSFHKFRARPVCSSSISDSDSSSDSDYSIENHEWDVFEKSKKDRSGITIGKQGFAKKGNIITTKHDPNVCGRRNTCRVMDFNISIGDGRSFDMKLNNNVYNALKVHSMSENKRTLKVHEKKEKSSAEQVMDEKTRLILYKLVNRGILDTINGAISTGKESYVFHGTEGNSENMAFPREVAIKVFKTTLNEFKNRQIYIKGDNRFKDKFSRQNPRKIIHIWAEKEMHNLIRIRKANILCPEAIILKKHVLVMKFIGTNGKPAPSLKEANLNHDELKQCYKEVIQIMKNLYSKCELVHGDFSEYNLLWHSNRVWVIDVSQSILKSHPNAMHFLHRDCRNITKFFDKKGLENVLNFNQLFTSVTGQEMTDECLGVDFLDVIQDYEKSKQHLACGVNTSQDNFDEMFERCCLNDKKKVKTDY